MAYFGDDLGWRTTNRLRDDVQSGKIPGIVDADTTLRIGVRGADGKPAELAKVPPPAIADLTITDDLPWEFSPVATAFESQANEFEALTFVATSRVGDEDARERRDAPHIHLVPLRLVAR